MSNLERMIELEIFDKDKHEERITKLLDGKLEHSERAEILQELRTNYNAVQQSMEELSTNNEKLQKDNSDLVLSNSKLFRRLGTDTEEQDEVVEQKEFSETVTIEELEGSAQ